MQVLGCNFSHISYYVLSVSFRHREIGLATEAQAAFFSYSRDDSEFALRLAAGLKAAGANVWLDQLDIAPGQRWARTVQDALNNCPRLLVILAPSSVRSTNVEDEVAFALEEHKTVIPVFYRDCKVPFQLRPFQYVDFRTDYDRGLKTLLRTLGVEQQAAAGAAASAVPKDTAADVSRMRTSVNERRSSSGWSRKKSRQRNKRAGKSKNASDKPP
jgi:TIR domain-containing protein